MELPDLNALVSGKRPPRRESRNRAPQLESSPNDERRLVGVLILVFAVAAVVFSISPVITNYDSYSYFPTAVSIVNRQTLSLNAYRPVQVVATNYGVGRSNRRLITYFPWPVAVFATPAVVVIDLIHLVGGPSADSIVANHAQIGSLVQLWSASIVTALACAVLALLAYRRLTGDTKTRRRLAVACGLVFAFGTSAWSTASRSLWQHGPSLLMLALGLLALDRIFPRNETEPTRLPPLAAFAAGAAFMAAVTVRPLNAMALALVAVLILWKARRAIGMYVVGSLVVVVPWLAITEANYGSLLQPYDKTSRLGLRSTFFESIAANLVSPARGILIFSPIVLVAGAGLATAWRRQTLGPLERMCAVAIAGYVIVLASFPMWWAGNSYGPRFMSETLPFLFVLALPFVAWMRAEYLERPAHRSVLFRLAAVAVTVLLAVSVIINAEGGLLRASTCWNGKAGTPQNVDNHTSRVWSWSDPQFDYGLRALGTEGLHAVMRCPSHV
jgi:hypothetical protein